MSMISEITENVTLRIINESDREQAMKILEKTEKACLISNSMKSVITPNFSILI